MRFNTKNGGYCDFRSNKDHKWWFHPTEGSLLDVAVSPIQLPEEADFEPVYESMFLNEELIKRHNIGAGDEVVISGLFTGIQGRSQNLPIVRTGIISLFPAPGERLPGVKIDDQNVESEIILIESRSIGGLSGSPVFARISVSFTLPTHDLDSSGKPIDTKDVQLTWCQAPGPYVFLGLVHGHWDIPVDQKNEVYPRQATQKDKENKELVNMGIAIVIPAKKIREVLYQPDLVESRRVFDQKRADLHAATPD
jgi:hypothetical protein